MTSNKEFYLNLSIISLILIIFIMIGCCFYEINCLVSTSQANYAELALKQTALIEELKYTKQEVTEIMTTYKKNVSSYQYVLLLISSVLLITATKLYR